MSVEEKAKKKQSKKSNITAQDPLSESAKKEIGGYEDAKLLEPTRYGDWDVKGRCSDF